MIETFKIVSGFYDTQAYMLQQQKNPQFVLTLMRSFLPIEL